MASLACVLRSSPRALSCVVLRSFSVSSASRIKEIVKRKENDVTVIEGVLKPSGSADKLVKLTDGDPKKACPVCALESRGIVIRHTDVRVLHQFVDSKHEMLPRKLTGICKRQERRVKSLVLMAQNAGLMPSPKKLKMPWETLNRYYVEETDVRDYKLHALKHLNHLFPENFNRDAKPVELKAIEESSK